MAKVMVEVKQVDLKTFREMYCIPETTILRGYILRISRHINKVTNGT